MVVAIYDFSLLAPSFGPRGRWFILFYRLRSGDWGWLARFECGSSALGGKERE